MYPCGLLPGRNRNRDRQQEDLRLKASPIAWGKVSAGRHTGTSSRYDSRWTTQGISCISVLLARGLRPPHEKPGGRADSINPAVRQVMEELGIDLSDEVPTKLTTEDVDAADVVITMGCGDACPIFPGKRYLDWELTDPAGKGIDDVRPIRDDIDQRVRELLTELVPARTM